MTTSRSFLGLGRLERLVALVALVGLVRLVGLVARLRLVGLVRLVAPVERLVGLDPVLVVGMVDLEPVVVE